MRGYASGTCRFRQEEPFCVRGGVLKWKSSCSSWEDPESGTALNLKWQLPTKERAGTSPQLFRKHFLSWPETLSAAFSFWPFFSPASSRLSFWVSLLLFSSLPSSFLPLSWEPAAPLVWVFALDFPRRPPRLRSPVPLPLF